MKVISKQRNSKMCIVCGMDNPIGLHAQFYNMEDGSVMTLFQYTEDYQSFPLRVHGGLIATMLDELGLRALWTGGSEDVFGVTMSMEVKYRKPVPYEEELIGRGIVERETPKFATIQTGIYDKKGTLLANAEVKYIKLDVSQIAEGVDDHEEMCYLIEDDVKEISFIPGESAGRL
ncbi:MAG: PaaI family thioesterase [Acetatifactor sp.]